MLSNSITLSVDALNNGTLTNQEYLRYTEFQNRSVYIGNGHTVAMKNNLSFYRSFPTKAGNFKGTAKSSIKLSQDIEIPGVDGVAVLTAPMILEVNFSFPVGATLAQMTEYRQRAIALLDTDTLMNQLNSQLMV